MLKRTILTLVEETKKTTEQEKFHFLFINSCSSAIAVDFFMSNMKTVIREFTVLAEHDAVPLVVVYVVCFYYHLALPCPIR